MKHPTITMNTSFFRDYKVNPSDPGVFLSSSEVRGDEYEREISGESVKGGTVYTYDNPKENPRPELRYFCRVGGGFQGFRLKRSAINFENQPA